MADQYLFVFPAKRYLKEGDHEVGKLDLIINARYGRGSGYETNWLLFSSPQNYAEPDFESVDNRMPVRDGGRILVAGITLADCIEREVRFDPDYVLSQLPSTRKLVVGGFHDADCVERIAAAAHAKGFEVLVDEDTTDMFFTRRALGIEIPLERRVWSLKDFGMAASQEAPSWVVETFREYRRDKPYRVKV
ncbi:Uncharacterised protein [uncultured archaeon]|nr:Uncharacterised protein [uncultured archaeon]